MIQQFHCWVQVQRNWKQDLKQILAYHVHNSIVHTSQKTEMTQVSIGRWMDKQSVVYTYNEVLFSFKKEGNFDTCYNMDEP